MLVDERVEVCEVCACVLMCSNSKYSSSITVQVWHHHVLEYRRTFVFDFLCRGQTDDERAG